MRGPDSSVTSGNIDQVALADLLLSHDDNLLVTAHAGADFDFGTDWRAYLHPPSVDALAVRVVDIHIRRALRIGHHRLRRDGQGVNLVGSEDPGFRYHPRQQ